ncbi:MAG: hypothetical protein ACK4SR_13215 [Thiobacillus sp.]
MHYSTVSRMVARYEGADE